MPKRTLHTSSALLIIGLFALTACAPEGTVPPETLKPGEVSITDSATAPPRESSETEPSKESGTKSSGDVATDSPEELSNIEGRQPVDVEKSTTLPDSFPIAAVPLPDGIQIDNVGERADGSWFVVIRSESIQTADSDMKALAQEGGFTVDELDPLSQTGFERMLTRDAITIHVLGYLDDKVPLVSLDITVDP